MITLEEAKTIVHAIMGEDVDITSSMRHVNEFLFIVVTPDSVEGNYDPFVKVDIRTGAINNFSPQEYDTPREIVNTLVQNSTRSVETTPLL